MPPQPLSPSGGDDSARIQDAIDKQAHVRLGPGIFRLSKALFVAKSIRISGVAKLLTFLRPALFSAAIVIAVPAEGYSTVLEDFGILYPGFSNVSAIQVGAARGEHTGFEARSLYIGNAGYGVNFRNASYWRITGTMIQNSTNAAVLVRNTNHADSGDSVISDSWFINPSITTGSAIGVLQFSGGGLRISNTKFNMFNQAYQLSLDANVNTCDLLMTGCSVESVGFSGPNAPILLQNPTGSSTFHSVIVSGCQFNGWGYQYANTGEDRVINAVNNVPAWCHLIVAKGNVVL